MHIRVLRKPEGKRALRIPRRRWKAKITTDLREKGWGGVWTGLIWLRTGTSGVLLLTR
jgi:hypothetical protein